MQNNRTFLKRWFVLKGNLLFYFEKRGDKVPIGVIIIEGCTIGELCRNNLSNFAVGLISTLHQIISKIKRDL
jgi:hypothetical protein